MKKNKIYLIVVVALVAIIGGYFVVYYVPCEKVDNVTLEVELPGEIKTKLTKVCYDEKFLSAIPQSTIDEIIDLKIEYLRLLHNIDSLQQEIQHLQNQIKYAETFSNEQWTLWMKENIPKMKVDLENKINVLQNSVNLLPEAKAKLEEKLESLTVTIRTDEEKEKITSQIDAIKSYPLIELDQKVYTWTDKVYITIVDLNSNKDSNQIEVIGGNKEKPLTIGTSRGFMKNTMFVETGYDTGIFTLEVILTGFFPYDVNGDGNSVDVPTKYSDFGFSGFAWLPAGREDKITVNYEFLKDKNIYAVSNINWNIGEIQSVVPLFIGNNPGTIRLIDPDMNIHPEEIDHILVKLTSSSDHEGIMFTLTETNEATAIFEGNFFVSDSETNQMKNILKAKLGDNVTATYYDRTLPYPYEYGDMLEITSVTKVEMQ